MHAGTVEGRTAFANRGCRQRAGEESRAGARIMTTKLRSTVEKVSMSQAAWLKKR